MSKIINLIIIISILVIILVILIPIFPSYFNKFNSYLSDLSAFFNYLVMGFGAFALLIACLAYKSAIMRPNLKLHIFPWGGGKELSLDINKKTHRVAMYRPTTEWYFYLENTGDASAKYPVVQIEFRDSFFPENAFPGWTAIHHVNAFGWNGFQWSPKDNIIVHPNLKIQLPTMYFTSMAIDDNPFYLLITIVADGFKKKTFKVPVQINYIDDI